MKRKCRCLFKRLDVPQAEEEKKRIQEDHGGDHRHRSRSGRLSFLHSAKFRNNFSATSRRKYDDRVLCSSSNFAAPRDFLGKRQITQKLSEVSQSVSCRWIGRSFCVAAFELRAPSQGLQSLSRKRPPRTQLVAIVAQCAKFCAVLPFMI